jgi:hypothetical protein
MTWPSDNPELYYPQSAETRDAGAGARRISDGGRAVALAGQAAPSRFARTLGSYTSFQDPVVFDEARAVSPPRQPVALTKYPRRVASTGSDLLRNALDVSVFDELDLMLHVLAFESGTADVTIALDTSMQIESDDAWVEVAEFTSVSSAPSYEVVNFSGVLRYVRFRVQSIDTAPAILIIHGMGRRRGRL